MRSGHAGVGTWVGLGTVALLALAMVAPFLYMVSLSLVGETDVFQWPPGNYAGALSALPFGRFVLNSAIVATCVAVAQVLTSAMAAYAFARLHFPGRDRLFLVFLSVLMVPAIVLLIPRFLIINAFGWVDTYAGLISTEVVSVWGIFLLREFFRTLPRDLEDAARLDGAGEWTILWRVILPLSKPAIATLAAFAFVDQWKNFLWPLVATRSVEMRVVEVGLARFHELYPTYWPYQMAVAVMATLPLVVVFFVAQRYVIRGIQLLNVSSPA
ncbi:MAG TPA: carbohydrate ABC transporter permease [Gemmatimonadales bacterium]